MASISRLTRRASVSESSNSRAIRVGMVGTEIPFGDGVWVPDRRAMRGFGALRRTARGRIRRLLAPGRARMDGRASSRRAESPLRRHSKGTGPTWTVWSEIFQTVLMSAIDGQGRVGGEALVPPGPRTSRRPSGLAFETGADGIDLAVDATGVGVRVVEQPGDQGRDGGHGNSFRGWGLGSRSASDARIRRTPTNCTRANTAASCTRACADGWPGVIAKGRVPGAGSRNNARHECGCQSWCLRVFRFWVVVRLTEHSAGRSPRMQGNLGEVEQRMWQAMYSSGSSAFLKKPMV